MIKMPAAKSINPLPGTDDDHGAYKAKADTQPAPKTDRFTQDRLGQNNHQDRGQKVDRIGFG